MQRPEPSVSGRLQRRNLVAYPRDCRARFSDARVGARERPLSLAREALARGDDAGRLALQGIDRTCVTAPSPTPTLTRTSRRDRGRTAAESPTCVPLFFFPTHPHLDIYGGERVLYTRSDSFSCVEHEKILPNLRLDELTSISKPHGC